LIDPKIQKIIDKLRAKEAGERIWLERNWVWIAVILAAGIGYIVGRLA
jgi:hypothetical protein